MKNTCFPCLLAGAAGAVVAALLPLVISPSRAETKLLPFQGRLTDAAGNALGDGARVVEFKMYDAPTGGNVKWAGEVHKLSINGGLVSTMLGSKAGLGSVDFAGATFLQITVDANNDGQITAADPPLLPRQSVVPAVYAAVAGQMQYVVPAAGGNSASVASADWSAVFDNGRPDTGRIDGAKIADQSITAAHLTGDLVNSSLIKDGEVKAADLADGAVTLERLFPRAASTAASVGNVALSARWSVDVDQTGVGTLTDTAESHISIRTSGRPVMVGIANSLLDYGLFNPGAPEVESGLEIFLFRRTLPDGAWVEKIGKRNAYTRFAKASRTAGSGIMALDVIPSGDYDYRRQYRATVAGTTATLQADGQLFALEL